MQNPDLVSPGSANVGEISRGSAGHSFRILRLPRSFRNVQRSLTLTTVADALSDCERMIDAEDERSLDDVCLHVLDVVCDGWILDVMLCLCASDDVCGWDGCQVPVGCQLDGWQHGTWQRRW